MEKKNIDSYEDIMYLPHPTSVKHPRMSLAERAAQFSPFAALTGYEDAIREEQRLTDVWVEPEEDIKAELNEKLRFLWDNLGKEIEVAITYFVPDERKSGGAYVTHTGVLQKIDQYAQVIILRDQTVIPLNRICGIDSEWFRKIDG